MEMISDTSQMQLLLTNATMLRSSHMINGRQHNFSFKIAWLPNGTLLGHVTHRQQRKPLDDEGALFYVVAVILIYGLSIVMIIASYIRKNKSDRKLNKYLKEMERLRKREFQMQLLSVKAAGVAGGADGGNGKGRQPGGPTGDAYPGASSITGAVAGGGVPEDSAKGGHKKAYAMSLKCLPKQKHKGPRYAFSTDNNKMVLELPATAMFYMTDSDNETSMEGDGFSMLSSLGGGGGWDADSRHSISPKDSNGSYVIDVDSEDAAALSGARRKLTGETLRRDSLASIKGTRVILVQPGDDDGDDDLGGGKGGGCGGGSGSAEVCLHAQLIVNPADAPEVASAGVVTEKPVKSVRLLLPEPEVTHVEHYKLRISDV